VTAVAFEVLDALGGFASLAKRSPTLDGAVPVRVAQACVPLLEGNALGWQVVLAPGLRVRRRLGRVVVEASAELRARLSTATVAAVRLRSGAAWVERGRVRVWTGLLVRPSRGVWLRVSSAANRRNVTFDVSEVFVADDGAFVPLVVDLTSTGEAADLQGEVACVTPLRPSVRVRVVPLRDAPHLGAAHAAFYDEAYFAAKKGTVTRKYRRLLARESAAVQEGPATAQVARVGPGAPTVHAAERFLSASAVQPGARAGDGRALEWAAFASPVALRASYDGHTLVVKPDSTALAAAAREVERTWAATYGDAAIERDRRALWYLTKYVTPHPPGEPHFFVKPFAFTSTPPGWSSVVEGVHGDGYDVLRGVVSTDSFFATPAVFHVRRVGEAIQVASGAPLVRVIPVPRSLLGARWRPVSFHDEPARSWA
jgi:hypothetical protein